MTAGNDKTIRLWNPNRDSDGAGSGVAREVKLYQGPHGYPVNDICMYNTMQQLVPQLEWRRSHTPLCGQITRQFKVCIGGR